MPKRLDKLLEEQIQRVFTIIDEQINLSTIDNQPLPFYDLNEMIKLEHEQCISPLRLSIKFRNENNKYGSECDIAGNYFALLWMYKNRKHLEQHRKKPINKNIVTQLELYELWLEDFTEVEEIEMNNIVSIDAYTINKATREIYPLKF